MPTTRSASTKQLKLEEFAEDSQAARQKPKQKAIGDHQPPKVRNVPSDSKTPAKRTAPPAEPTSSGKRQKQQQISSDDVNKLEEPILINRAPVLQLWGAVVAEFIHSDLSWPACLSIGSAISTLCAMSKGKAIGMIEPKDEEASKDRKEKSSKGKQGTEEYHVMGFPLHLKDDAVLVSGKPKKSNEATLQAKFGSNQYDAVKKAMTDAVQSWSGNEDELEKNAFHMYEKFRPNVAAGQKGWGRKGELNLHEIASVIGRPS